jgi:hypothetical protein
MLTPAEQLDPSGIMHLLDTSSATPAAISRTWFVVLVINAIHKFFPSKNNSLEEVDGQQNPVDSDDGSDSPTSGTVTPSGATEGEEILQAGHVAASKAGGRRRKAPRKR